MFKLISLHNLMSRKVGTILVHPLETVRKIVYFDPLAYSSCLNLFPWVLGGLGRVFQEIVPIECDIFV